MSALNCPRDGALLIDRNHLSLPWHLCGQCGGMYMSLSIITESQSLLNEIIAKAVTWPRSGFGCPQCGRTMHVAHHKGAEIDICIHCSTVWADVEEVDSIMRTYLREEIKDLVLDQSIVHTPQVLTNISFSRAIDFLGDALGSIF